jgi:hypothetical protein
MARLAVGVICVIKMNVSPINHRVTAGTLPGPVTSGGSVAARAVVVTRVVEVDLIPTGGVVADCTRGQVMVCGGSVAQGTVDRQHDMIDRGHRPGCRHMAIGARIGVVQRRSSVAGCTVGGRIVGIDDVVPTGSGVT